MSKAFTLFTFIVHGKNNIVEKHRDLPASMSMFLSAAPYCLNEESKHLVLTADEEERNACLTGLGKIAQRINAYALPGTVINDLVDKVLTLREVHPCAEVKLHLGLTRDNESKSFMNL